MTHETSMKTSILIILALACAGAANGQEPLSGNKALTVFPPNTAPELYIQRPETKLQDFVATFEPVSNVTQNGTAIPQRCVIYGHDFIEGSTLFSRNKTDKKVEIAVNLADFSEPAIVLFILEPGEAVLLVYKDAKWQLVYRQTPPPPDKAKAARDKAKEGVK